MADALITTERGHVLIASRVVERIAAVAADEVDGTVTTASTLERLTARSRPKVDVRLAGQRARIEMSVGVRWPMPLAEVAASVRDHVTQRVESLTSLQIDGVSVEVANVVYDGDREGARP